MKRRNRQVYRELEERSRLLDEMTVGAQALLDYTERLESENRALRLGVSTLREVLAEGQEVIDTAIDGVA